MIHKKQNEKNKLSLNQEQLKLSAELRGDIISYTLPFKNGHYIVGGLWVSSLILLAIGLKFRSKPKEMDPKDHVGNSILFATILATAASLQPCFGSCNNHEKPDDLIYESTIEYKVQQELDAKRRAAEPIIVPVVPAL